jgi:hypothetical protein
MRILPVFYFPPIAWFAAAADSKSIILEQWAHYRKQNYTNRMSIKTPEKILHLSIPVRKLGEQTPICRAEIAYDWRWQHDHWKSLESAYRRSPYFEYYEDELKVFFESEEPSLLKHQLEILKTLNRLLDLDLEWTLSEEYLTATQLEEDFRDAFPTKTEQLPLRFNSKPYQQVFGSEFTPNLSILDLLFNKGPESVQFIRGCWTDK